MIPVRLRGIYLALNVNDPANQMSPRLQCSPCPWDGGGEGAADKGHRDSSPRMGRDHLLSLKIKIKSK